MMPMLFQLATERRLHLGLTQQELAELAGVSVRLIRELEAGRANPGLRQLTGILDALGLELTANEKKR